MVGRIPPAHIFLVVTGTFIENYTIKISEGKCNCNLKNNYARNFDEKHVLLYEIIRKEIDIYQKFKFLFFSFLIDQIDAF